MLHNLCVSENANSVGVELVQQVFDLLLASQEYKRGPSILIQVGYVCLRDALGADSIHVLEKLPKLLSLNDALLIGVYSLELPSELIEEPNMLL